MLESSLDACSPNSSLHGRAKVVTWSRWSCVRPKGFDCEFVPAVSQLSVEYLGIAEVVFEDDHGACLVNFLGTSVG